MFYRMSTKNSPQQETKAKVILTSVSIAGLTALIAIISGIISIKPSEPQLQVPPMPGYYNVTTVSDGDTFSVNMDGREEKVRLIGVDTPETVKPNSPVECYGVAASNHLKLLLGGQSVRLESDPINQNRDRYDRLLRYAYTKDGVFVNKKIISEGYGFAYLTFPFTKSEEFRLAQVSARERGVGVWNGECTIDESDTTRPKSNEL